MSSLVCPACERTVSPARGAAAGWLCACGEPLDLEPAAPDVSRELFDERAGRPRQGDTGFVGGVWRFRELVEPATTAAEVVSLLEGDTPLHGGDTTAPLARWAGTDELWIKHEGANPTGSFKDRGMTVAVTRARALGARVLACASTGNTAASLAAYAARAGLPALVVAPEGGTAAGKLSQAVAHGARCVLVRGDFDLALARVRELAATGEVTLLNSLNPYRLAGQKTIVLELLADLGWRAPDWIVLPAGNLGNTSAFGRALEQALATGLIEHAPRLAAVQAAGAAPFAQAFEGGFERLEPVEARTVASAIRIGHPASYARAVRAIRATRGVVLAVEDTELLEAKAAVDRAGLGAEPASCASLAGLRRLVARGLVTPSERVVCVLTGHLLKDPDTTLAWHRGELGGEASGHNPPRVIDGSLDQLRGVIPG